MCFLVFVAGVTFIMTLLVLLIFLVSAIKSNIKVCCLLWCTYGSEIIFLIKPLFEVIGFYDDMEVTLERAVKELKEGSSEPMMNQVFDDVHCEDCVNDSVCNIDCDFISAVNCHVDRDFVRVDNELKYETDHFVENGDLF